MDEVVAYRQTVGGVVGVYYPHYNHLYSPAALTDQAGVVVERYTYDAYGKQTITSATGVVRQKSAVGFNRGFTGYIADNETGLLHARARQYSTTLGRFVSRDWMTSLDTDRARRLVLKSEILFSFFYPAPASGYVDGLSLYGAYFSPNYTDSLGLTIDEDVTGQVACGSIRVWIINDWPNMQGNGDAYLNMEFTNNNSCVCCEGGAKFTTRGSSMGKDRSDPLNPRPVPRLRKKWIGLPESEDTPDSIQINPWVNEDIDRIDIEIQVKCKEAVIATVYAWVKWMNKVPYAGFGTGSAGVAQNNAIFLKDPWLKDGGPCSQPSKVQVDAGGGK